jgi:hypothetical protein
VRSLQIVDMFSLLSGRESNGDVWLNFGVLFEFVVFGRDLGVLLANMGDGYG